MAIAPVVPDRVGVVAAPDIQPDINRGFLAGAHRGGVRTRRRRIPPRARRRRTSRRACVLVRDARQGALLTARGYPCGQMVVGRPGDPPLPTRLAQSSHPMKNDQILSQISEYCLQAYMAESTFGRRAVNDGKLVHRLREGKRITIDTLDRIQAYIAASMPGGVPPPRGLEVPPEKRDPRGNFRFFENRQKYLLFVHTCSEKRVIAERAALDIGSIHR